MIYPGISLQIRWFSGEPMLRDQKKCCVMICYLCVKHFCRLPILLVLREKFDLFFQMRL